MKFNCLNCGEEYVEEDAKYLDHNSDGWWCDYCEHLNYHAGVIRPQYKLFLESNGVESTTINKPLVKLKKQMSPLRYPGGKSKIADFVLDNLDQNQTKTFVSPYTGGGSVEFALLQAGVVESLVINDIDYALYCLYYCILNNHEELIDRIYNPTSFELFAKCKKLIVNEDFNHDKMDIAYAYLINNRMSFSGIFNAGRQGGKNGSESDMKSRWNPKSIEKRIREINKMRDKITLLNMDALKIIEEYSQNSNTTLYIDPPYVAKGSQLYQNYYEENQHRELMWLIDSLYSQLPAADILVFYDDHEIFEEIGLYSEEVRLSRRFSIAN